MSNVTTVRSYDEALVTLKKGEEGIKVDNKHCQYKGNEESFNKFVDALASNKTCKKLDLGNNKIGASGAEKIAYALKINNTLQVLDLKTNAIGPKGAQKLADALKVNKSLRELNLWNNRIKEGCVAIGEALKNNFTLEALNLKTNAVGPTGAQKLADALKVNKSLRELNLWYNGIKKGCVAIGEALKTNRSLETLDLGNNKIGAISAERIAEALKENVTLQNLNLLENEIDEQLCEQIDASLVENRSPVTARRKDNIIKARNELIQVHDWLRGMGLGDYIDNAVAQNLDSMDIVRGIVDGHANGEEELANALGVSTIGDKTKLHKGLSCNDKRKALVHPRNRNNSAERYHCFLAHEWGDKNTNYLTHEVVSQINKELKKKGLTTWFDEDRMHGFIFNDMARGIDKSGKVVVFITKRYMERLMNENNNCAKEFNYATQHNAIGVHNIIPVVIETSMLDTSKWRGSLGMNLSSKLFVDMSTERLRKQKIDELYNKILDL